MFVTNTGDKAVYSWSVRLNTRESHINNLWNGTYDNSAGTVMVDATFYNSTIAPNGGIQTFGFCVDTLGTDYVAEVETVFSE